MEKVAFEAKTQEELDAATAKLAFYEQEANTAADEMKQAEDQVAEELNDKTMQVIL